MSISIAISVIGNAVQQNKQAILDRSHEVSTGRPRNMAEKLGANGLKTYAMLENQAKKFESLQNAAQASEHRLDTQSSALSHFFDQAEMVHSAPEVAISTPTYAEDIFNGLVSSLNTQSGGTFLFGGTSSQSSPLPNAGAILGDVKAVFAAAGGQASGVAAVKDWFMSAGGGYDQMTDHIVPSNGRVPDPALSDVALATVREDPIRQALLGTALAAISEEFNSPLAMEESKLQLASAASKGIPLQARIGSYASRVSNAEDFFQQRVMETELQMNDMAGVDLYESVTELQRLTRHTDMLYAVQARLNNLSLLNHLK